MEIIKCNTEFDFKRLTLANPEPLQSSTYFTKIYLENNKPFCIQLPKCTTKQGLIDIKGMKYCDLMYERSQNEDLINWLEKLEYACQDKLCEKKDLWFQTELNRDDIETMMSPLMRLYQSGKYILIRSSLTSQKINGLDKSIAYNEQEVTVDIDKLEQNDYIIPLIIIHGIKFSSRSFEIDIRLSQIMIFNKPTNSPCLIKYVGNCNIQNTLDIKQPLNIEKKENTVLLQNNTVLKKFNTTKDSTTKDSTTKDSTTKDSTTKDSTKLIKDNIMPNKRLDIVTSPLEEVVLDYKNISDSIILKKPNEVYYEIYKTAREKAKQLRKVAMEAYLEAKEIKTKYMLSDFDDSDEYSSDNNSNDDYSD